jgi:hypothetical protein
MFEVFMAVKIQVEAFWVVTPCSVAVGYQRFRGPCCLHLQGEMKMEATRSSKMFVSYHNTARHLNPEYFNKNKNVNTEKTPYITC